MKKEFLYALSVAVVLSFGVPAIAVTDLANPGFETGDFTGWDVTVPSGASADVVSIHTSNSGTNYTPPAGDYFALLKTDGPGSETTISQTFTAAPGNMIYGRAFFDARDYPPYIDYAYVKIIDPSLGEITLFYADVAGTGPGGETPWVSWGYWCASAGSYTIVAGIANALDSVADSYMGVDVLYTVACDIKPGSWPNSINLGSKGVIPVAILGSDGYDVSAIDPDTLWFEFAWADKSALEDVNGDGHMDLVAHFRTQDTWIQPWYTWGYIEWLLWDGTYQWCLDEIRIVPPNK